MAAEKHDAHETTKTVPDISSLHDVGRTKSEEDTRARTKTVITATNAMIANSGCRARLIKDATKMMTTTEIAVGTTTVGDDRILENLDVILVFVPRNQVTHRHPHHPRDQTDIHGGHTITDNPPPPAAGVELSVVLYVMFDSLRDFDREQYRSTMGALTLRSSFRNMIPEIIDASVIRAFKTGVRDRYTTQELATRQITTARKLFEIVDRCAHADDALRRKNDKPKKGGEKKPAKDAPESSKKKSRKSGKRKAQTEVLVAEYAEPPKHPDPQRDDTKKIWCLIHKSDKHSLEACFVFKKPLAKQLALEKGKRVRVVEKATEAATQDSDSAYPDSHIHVSHIFGGSTAYSSKQERSNSLKQTTPRLLLTPTDQPFHGITPQSSSKPLGKITLPVTFGQANNFRTEQITGFDTAYNAIIRRTALAKFMAGSHYTYQVLKMPGPKGTITIQGNAKLAGQCDRRSLDMVEHTPNPPATAEPPKKVSKTNKTPKPDDAIKIVPLSSAIPDKTVKIEASLDEK
uniref:Retrotransposon protein, putative, Ty3-gypsy subclass n=2 Tax=Oryza sativa subsp. japonica TaxID=39947 RepID=Q53KN5_ORYSJ|nr:retrotransposon protein, putative, Ty3-gypsy sub-class [Oryza sativa Japonica Group]ABA93343.1 retrotransposon protein, putative, Ty3-gypsy subclass [Oryza sativa Japonica Group]